MKKLIFIICLITVFFFTGLNEVSAQWVVNVDVNDSECNCGTITKKSVFITIIDLTPTPETIVNNREFVVTGETPPYETSGDETILWNCEDCYYVYARVYYYNSNGECCDGYESATIDGQDLIDEYDLATIIMD